MAAPSCNDAPMKVCRRVSWSSWAIRVRSSRRAFSFRTRSSSRFRDSISVPVAYHHLTRAFFHQGVITKQEPPVDAIRTQQSCFDFERVVRGQSSPARGSHLLQVKSVAATRSTSASTNCRAGPLPIMSLNLLSFGTWSPDRTLLSLSIERIFVAACRDSLYCR